MFVAFRVTHALLVNKRYVVCGSVLGTKKERIFTWFLVRLRLENTLCKIKVRKAIAILSSPGTAFWPEKLERSGFQELM